MIWNLNPIFSDLRSGRFLMEDLYNPENMDSARRLSQIIALAEREFRSQMYRTIKYRLVASFCTHSKSSENDPTKDRDLKSRQSETQKKTCLYGSIPFQNFKNYQNRCNSLRKRWKQRFFKKSYISAFFWYPGTLNGSWTHRFIIFEDTVSSI